MYNNENASDNAANQLYKTDKNRVKGVSRPAGRAEGYSPSTSGAFWEKRRKNLSTKKNITLNCKRRKFKPNCSNALA